jgi:endoglucanase
MRLRKRALAVLSASLFLVAGLHPSTAVAAGSGPWQIGIYEFPQCVEVQGGSISNSAQVQLWYCGDYNVAHREWYMQEIQPGWWHIWNKKSGKCLNVQGASTKNSAKIIQYTCQGVDKFNDQWELLGPLGSGANGDLYWIMNRKSRLCLNAQGASSANGTDLIQYTCSGAWNNLFTWWPGR